MDETAKTNSKLVVTVVSASFGGGLEGGNGGGRGGEGSEGGGIGGGQSYGKGPVSTLYVSLCMAWPAISGKEDAQVPAHMSVAVRQWPAGVGYAKKVVLEQI